MTRSKYLRALQRLEALRDLGSDEILAHFGLERKRSLITRIAGPVAGFGAGFISGVGAGLLFAPMSGDETRKWLRERIDEVLQEFKTTEEQTGEGATASGGAGATKSSSSTTRQGI